MRYHSLNELSNAQIALLLMRSLSSILSVTGRSLDRSLESQLLGGYLLLANSNIQLRKDIPRANLMVYAYRRLRERPSREVSFPKHAALESFNNKYLKLLGIAKLREFYAEDAKRPDPLSSYEHDLTELMSKLLGLSKKVPRFDAKEVAQQLWWRRNDRIPPEVRRLSDNQLARLLLRSLWRNQDTGGSSSRSIESRLLECYTTQTPIDIEFREEGPLYLEGGRRAKKRRRLLKFPGFKSPDSYSQRNLKLLALCHMRALYREDAKKKEHWPIRDLQLSEMACKLLALPEDFPQFDPEEVLRASLWKRFAAVEKAFG